MGGLDDRLVERVQMMVDGWTDAMMWEGGCSF